MEEAIAGTGLFTVEVKVRPGNRILVLMDSDTGVSIDDCTKLSRAIETGLNRDVEDFELEVSSAGLGEPFKTGRQYSKNIGRQVQALTREGRKFTGKLVGADENGIVIEEKRNKKEINQINLAFENLKETKLVISF